MVAGDLGRTRTVVAGLDRQSRARRQMRLEMASNERDGLVRVLIGDEAAGNLGVRLARDDRLLARALITPPTCRSPRASVASTVARASSSLARRTARVHPLAGDMQHR